MSRVNNGRVFESRECDNCGEATFIKPRNGNPNYCGICGHALNWNDGLKSTAGPPYSDGSEEHDAGEQHSPNHPTE